MAQHFDSLLPAGKKWKLVWHDEFDGDTLDRSKWDFRLHLLQTRHKTFTEEGVALDGNGNLVLSLIEKDGQYYSPHLQTGSNYLDRPGRDFCFNENAGSGMKWPVAAFAEQKFLHKFGYYEIRCKLQQKPGWWSAFWLQSPIIGCCPDPMKAGVEVDIMECFSPDGKISHNNHWSGYGPDHLCCGSGDRQVDPAAWHVFGLDWSPAGYVYYVDGVESWRVAGPVSDTEQFILVSTECMGYRNGPNPSPLLKKENLPDAFLVDYVRVFDETR